LVDVFGEDWVFKLAKGFVSAIIFIFILTIVFVFENLRGTLTKTN